VVLNPGRHEQQVAGPERIVPAIVNENASAADDNVNLILDMRCLAIGRHGDREFHVKRAALQNENGALARGTRALASARRITPARSIVFVLEFFSVAAQQKARREHNKSG
jgi:hypothetical protein